MCSYSKDDELFADL